MNVILDKPNEWLTDISILCCGYLRKSLLKDLLLSSSVYNLNDCVYKEKAVLCVLIKK